MEKNVHKIGIFVNHDEQVEASTKVVVFGTLFVTGPALICLDLFMIYKFFSDGESFSDLENKAKIGLFLMFVGGPLCLWFFYRYAQENYGWFSKRKS